MTRIIIQSNGGQQLEVEQATFDAGYFPGYWYVADAGPSGSTEPAVLDQHVAVLVPAASGSATAAALRAALVPRGKVDQKVWPVGRRIGWCGDSITAGTGSTNASTNSFRALAPLIAGTARIRSFAESINGGVAGDRSDQLLARMDGIIASSPAPEALFVLIGTNDAGQSVPLTTFAANIQAIVAKAQTAGIPVAIGTVPPRGSSATATTHALLRAYNLWLRLWAPTVGVPLAAVHAALTDPATGYLAATLDSGDGTHPNNAGHLAIAQVATAALIAMQRDYPWPAASGPLTSFGLITNPLISGTTGWGTLTGSPTTTSAAPIAGDGLPAGNWLSVQQDNSANAGGSANAQVVTTLGSGWSVGDVLLVCYWGKQTGGTGNHKVQILNQSNAVLANSNDGIKAANGVGVPFLTIFTVPAGTTQLKLALAANAAASQNATQFIGAVDIFNLTASGLTAFPYAT